MKRWIAYLTILFCLGIVFAEKIKINFLLFYFLSLIFLFLSILFLKKNTFFNIFLLCLCFLLGVLFLKNAYILPKCHISKFINYKAERPCLVKGFIESQPILKNNRTTFIFKTIQIQTGNLKYNCCGSILVNLKTRQNFSYGEELILMGNLYRPYGFGKQNNNYKEYLYKQGLYAVMHVKSERAITRLNNNRGFIVKRFAFWLKDKIEAVISKYVSTVTASILDAMILGERKNISSLVYNSMVRTGTVHILVVSGFNVGIVTSIVFLLLKMFRLPFRIRFFLAIAALIVYCLLTGASNPVVRATVMAGVFTLSRLLKREPDIYNSCAIAAIFILFINPKQLFDIGFQLSFISVISIIYLYPKIKSLLNIVDIKIKFLRFLAEGCAVSFSAWMGTMGIVAYNFRIFSPVTVLANIFIVPLATLITLCGFSLVIIGIFCPCLTPIFASSCELAVTLLLRTNMLLVKLPGSHFYLP
jgi:competence protein ComEC